MSTGKYHAVNNDTGEQVSCDANGRPIAQFHHNVSGVAFAAPNASSGFIVPVSVSISSARSGSPEALSVLVACSRSTKETPDPAIIPGASFRCCSAAAAAAAAAAFVTLTFATVSYSMLLQIEN